MTLKEQFEGRWFYCELCGCVSITCPVCHNASCTGGGCDICYDEFELVSNADPSELPSKDEVPFHRDELAFLLGQHNVIDDDDMWY